MREREIKNPELYMNALLGLENPLKLQSRAFAEELGLERISIAPAEGQLIKTLVRMHACKKFVEIGTLTGLSAQYLFEGLAAGGELWTLEKEARHAEMARRVFSQIDQQEKKIHLVVGDAREELKILSDLGPFDGVFIDGNKAAYGDYLEWAELHVRPGGLILADNIFLNGAVWGDTQSRFSEKQIRIMQQFNQRLADPSLFESAIVPSFEGLYVGIKLK